jgi:hypothetical protein
VDGHPDIARPSSLHGTPRRERKAKKCACAVGNVLIHVGEQKATLDQMTRSMCVGTAGGVESAIVKAEGLCARVEDVRLKPHWGSKASSHERRTPGKSRRGLASLPAKPGRWRQT